MHQRRLAILLLKPSITSGIVCFILAVGLLVLSNYSYIVDDPRFSDYFYGDYGIVVAFERYFDSFDNGFTGLMPTQSLSYNVLVLIAAVTTGLLTYGFLQLITKFLAMVLGDYLTVANANAEEKSTIDELVIRWIVRLVSFALYVLYWLLFMAILVPFCILAARVSATDLLSLSVWISSVSSVIVLAISLHIHVVFLRLLLLRPRIYGGGEEVLEAIYVEELQHSLPGETIEQE
jgi:hypothetical protein